MSVEWVRGKQAPEVMAEFCRRLDELAAGQMGESAVALTGGESAAEFYDALAGHGVPERLSFYWSDERLVPANDKDSNVELAYQHLLRPAGIGASRIHAPDTRLAPEACASAYADTIWAQVGAGPDGIPQFPLIVLGLGEDGHTGSLFPGRDPYAQDDLLVRAVEAAPDHPHGRITFTPRLINAAREVWFVITQSPAKTWAVEQLEQRTATVMQVPSLTVDPAQTRITVFLA